MKGKAGTGVGSYGAIGRACGAGRAMGLLYSTGSPTWLNCSCVPTVNDYRTHWTLRSAYIDMGLVEVGIIDGQMESGAPKGKVPQAS